MEEIKRLDEKVTQLEETVKYLLYLSNHQKKGKKKKDGGKKGKKKDCSSGDK